MPFELTPTIRGAAGRYCAACSDEDSAALRRYTRQDAREISLTDVQLLSRALRRLPRPEAGASDAAVWVHELLQGAAPVLPEFKRDRTPHPELEPRLQQLRAAAENREYAAMVSDVCCEEGDGRDAAEMNTYRSQLAVGANLLVSMGTMFAVGYWAGGTEEEPHGPRAAMCGLACCIVTMVVEMTLFVIGASRVDAKQDERARKARRGQSDLTRLREFYPREVGPSKRGTSQFSRTRLKQF